MAALTARGEFFQHLTMSDGLSQPSVMSITQDCLGRMWFGTREGVNVYDGTSIISYKGWVQDPVEGKEIWIGNEVSAIVPDADGNLYMLIDNSVVEFDIMTERFSRVTSGENIMALANDGNSIIVIADDSIFVKTPADTGFRLHFTMPSVDEIMDLAVDSINYYVSTMSGLHVFDRRTRRSSVMLPDEAIYSVYISKDHTLWISAFNGGLYRKGKGDAAPVLVSSPSVPQGLAGGQQSRRAVEDKFGRIWYGSFTGLFCYDPVSGKTRHIEVPANIGGLSHSSVFGMYVDRVGNIWTGTYYGGVNYFSPNNVQYVNFNYETETPVGMFISLVIDMETDREGNLWFGTDGAGVCCVDSSWNIVTRLTTQSAPLALRQNNIKAMAYSPEFNRLFIGTHLGGLSVYDIGNRTLRNYLDLPAEENIPGEVINHMAVYGERLFIASRKGISEMDIPTGKIKFLTEELKPQLFDVDSNGDIYCVARENVYVIRHPGSPSQKIELFKDGSGMGTAASIRCADDALYIGTLGNGLICFPDYKPEIKHFYSGVSQLPDDYCYALEAGNGKTLYIMTSRHIVRYNPADGSFRSVPFARYFPQSHLIAECALFRHGDGSIFVGSTKGVTKFYGDIFERNAVGDNSGSLYFSRLSVSNRNVVPGDGSGVLDRTLPYASHIHLAHDQNNFTLHIGRNDYIADSGPAALEYMLEGVDKDWRMTTDSEISYNNLSPGKYKLRVRWQGDSEELSMDVEVAQPWYGTWWAWLIYAVAFCGLAYFIVSKTRDAARLRMSLRDEQLEKEQIAKLNQEKLVFFTNVSHEFQTPLTLIMSHIDLLLSKYKRNSLLTDRLLRLREHSQQMSHLITQLLEFRKLQQNHQVLRIGRHDASLSLNRNALPFVNHAATRSITFVIELPDEPVYGWYDSAFMDRVLVNLLSNAFKYTPDGGTIRCSVKADGNEKIVFTVSDNGKGISEKDLPFIFDRFYNGESEALKRKNIDYRSTGIGLAFAKSIVDKHHGVISVDSHEGVGTTFTVVIPSVQAPYLNDDGVVFEAAGGEGSDFDAVRSDEAVTSLTEREQNAEAESEDGDTSDDKHPEQPHILVVEDNDELRNNLVSFFNRYFHVSVASDGEEGLAKAREENPDIIVSDVMMPRMSGTEMCRRIKGDFDLCHIPVILLTALSASESKLEGYNANADDYLTKPFESSILLARIDNLLRIRKILQSQFTRKPVSEIDMTVVNPLDRTLLKRTSEVIEAHIDDQELDIPTICKEIGISRSLFYNKFKSLTGMTPNAYILNYRLKYAATLLTAQPQLSVADVAYMTGFATPVYFSRCFKKQHGVSPVQYRKEETASEDATDTEFD